MQALRFRIGERWLAVDLRWVREVCPMVAMRPLPGGPAWLRGLFDWHGTLLPAVDGGTLLGGEPVAPRLGARLLLLHGATLDRDEARRAMFGLLVHAVEGVESIDRAEAWHARGGLPDMPFLGEVVRVGDRETLLLDAGVLAARHAALLECSGALATPASGAAPP